MAGGIASVPFYETFRQVSNGSPVFGYGVPYPMMFHRGGADIGPIMQRTSWAAHIRGGLQRGLPLAGVNVDLTKVAVFSITGFSAA